MKVIAKTDANYLLEASKEELALILGYRNPYTDNFSTDMLKIGKEIPVAKIVAVSRFVRTLDTRSLSEITQSLTRAISDVNDAISTTEEVTLFAKLSDEDQS
jgi:hypothetical protein